MRAARNKRLTSADTGLRPLVMLALMKNVLLQNRYALHDIRRHAAASNVMYVNSVTRCFWRHPQPKANSITLKQGIKTAGNKCKLNNTGTYNKQNSGSTDGQRSHSYSLLHNSRTEEAVHAASYPAGAWVLFSPVKR